MAVLLKSSSFVPPALRPVQPGESVYTNPVGKHESPDPFVTYDGERGYYYLLFTRGRELRIFRARHIDDLRDSDDSYCAFSANDDNGVYGSIWAPEMHKIGGLWYIYTSGNISKEDKNIRTLFIMRSKTDDPFDGFEFAGFPDKDMRAIDPTVYTHTDGTLYMCYAAEGRGNRLHIRKMSSPTSFASKSGTLICEAELPWEKVPPYVGDSTIAEGSFFVSSPDKKRLFIIYSANGCWSDYYRLGVLEYTGDGELTDASSWKKDERFLFELGNGSFGPGHASYFTSPDGSELWIAYHAMHNTNTEVRFAPRFLHFQRVYFDETGYPVIGEPLPMNIPYTAPSGE